MKVLKIILVLVGSVAIFAGSALAGGMSRQERLSMIKRVEKKIEQIGLREAQTNDSGDLGWGEGPILAAMVNMYEATGERKWLDLIKQHVDTAFSFLDDHDKDGFLSWHTDYYTPEPAHLKASASPGNRGTGKIKVLESVVPGKGPDKGGYWSYRMLGHPLRVIFLDRKRFCVVDEDMHMPALVSPFVRSGLHWSSILKYEPGKAVWRKIRGVKFTITGQPEPGDSFYIECTPAPEYDYVVHDGMMTMPIARFIQIVLSNPELKSRYGETARGYLAFLERHFFDKWDKKRWIELPGGRGLYYWPKTKWRPKRSLPMNQYTAFGRTIIRLYQITKKPKYLDRATKMARMVKSLLKVKNDAYWWYYCEPVAKWDGSRKPTSAEHTHYADMDVGFMIDAYEAGIVFTKADMQKLTNTFIKVMWNKSLENPTVAGAVDGSNGTSKHLCDFVRLAQFDPRVWTICYKINRNSNSVSFLAQILACEKYAK